MNKKWKYILFIIAAVAFAYLMPSPISDMIFENKNASINSSIDTTEIITEIKGRLKSQLRLLLLDSLRKSVSPEGKKIIVYKHANEDSIYNEAKNYWYDKILSDTSELSPDTGTISNVNEYLFTSIVDTTYEVFDTSGRITDKLEIESGFYSPLFIHPGSFHGFNITHTRFDYKPKISSFNLFNNFELGAQAGAGYGIINKKFDFYVGAGVTYKL